LSQFAAVPDLGLSRKHKQRSSLEDRDLSTSDSGIPGPTDTVAGTFYVQFPMGDFMCLRFPKGQYSAQFTFVDDVTIDFKEFPDGSWIGNFNPENW